MKYLFHVFSSYHWLNGEQIFFPLRSLKISYIIQVTAVLYFILFVLIYIVTNPVIFKSEFIVRTPFETAVIVRGMCLIIIHYFKCFMVVNCFVKVPKVSIIMETMIIESHNVIKLIIIKYLIIIYIVFFEFYNNIKIIAIIFFNVFNIIVDKFSNII